MNDILDNYYWPEGRPADPLAHFRAERDKWTDFFSGARKGGKPHVTALASGILADTCMVIRKLEALETNGKTI